MICKCGAKMGVVNVVSTKEKTLRKRKCKACGHSFFTMEFICNDQRGAREALHRYKALERLKRESEGK